MNDINYIKNFIYNAKLNNISIGCSSDKVTEIIKEDGIYYLKESKSDKLSKEYHIMKWLYNILPVPEIIFYVEENNEKKLLTKKLKGEMICSDEIYDYPEKVMFLAAQAIKMLQKVDISNCEFNNNIDIKLKEAKSNIDKNLITYENMNDNTKDKFKSLEELYTYLQENKPTEKLCFSHGDLSLPNIFYSNDKISGFLDLGDSGIADYWYDIAILVKSIRRNYEDVKYENMFFEYLNIKPDYNIIDYYILLTELFT
jgi:aminoglycoside 3'-phosphotransferase III